MRRAGPSSAGKRNPPTTERESQSWVKVDKRPQERCEGQGTLGTKVEYRKVKELQGEESLIWKTRYIPDENLGTSSVDNQSAQFALPIHNRRKSGGFSQ